jgi:hypothetical protein
MRSRYSPYESKTMTLISSFTQFFSRTDPNHED